MKIFKFEKQKQFYNYYKLILTEITYNNQTWAEGTLIWTEKYSMQARLVHITMVGDINQQYSGSSWLIAGIYNLLDI